MAAIYDIGGVLDVLAGALADIPASGIRTISKFFATDTGNWYLTVDGGTTWVNFTEPGQPITTVVLADDASIDFVDATSGACVVIVSGNANYDAMFTWTSDGSTGDKYSNWNYVKYIASGGSEEDGYLNIITTGTQVSIKNRTGASITMGLLRMVV